MKKIDFDGKFKVYLEKKNGVFIVRDSQGLTYQVFRAFFAANRVYEKLKDVLEIKDEKDRALRTLKYFRKREYVIYHEYRNRVLSGKSTPEDAILERTRFYSYQVLDNVIGVLKLKK